MAENKVSVEVTLEQQAALKALGILGREINKQEANFSNLGKEADASMGVIGQATQGVSTGFKSLVGGVTIANLASSAIIGTANTLKDFVVGSINAAIEQEEAINKLSQALRATGTYSNEAVESFNAFSGVMANTTKYGDDLILSQIAIAKSFGATDNQAKELIKAAANLSATFGGSLEDNVKKLGQTLNGEVGKLGKLVPELKDLSKEALSSGDALDIVNKKFGGAAAAEISTYAGKLGQMKKAFGELQETAGGFLVESGLADSFIKTANLLNLINQKISDSKTASARAAGGFQETGESIKQLERKYSQLYTEAEKAKEIINNPSFFDKMLARPVAAAENLKRLQGEMAATKLIIDQFNANNKSTYDPNAKGKGVASTEISEKEQAEIDSRNAANLALQESYVAQAAWEAEQDLMKRQITEENFAIELEQLKGIEQAKIDAKFDAEEQKIMAANKGATEEILLEKMRADKSFAIQKANADAEKRLKEKQAADEAAINQMRVTSLGNFLGASSLLLKEGTKEQQALSIANALISTYEAAANALKLQPVWPLGISTAALVTAQGLAQVRNITAQRFQDGGIVKGSAYTGDTIGVRVNSGEMILNRQQQTELFNMANGSGSSDASLVEEVRALRSAISSQPINLTVDGRVLATVIRDQVKSGFKIA